ncbi:hypothetical protein NVP1161O_026 [Vibrio phage 1.161.O._10N.261.48.C5]|nr:hypothetical protein NVP1161O_026 [Vibrio phage 1.161.O._10N.261.48.C5]
MTDLNNLFGQSNQSTTGSGVQTGGTVEIGTTVEGQSTQIKTSDQTVAIQVNDDASIQIGGSQAVTEIVNEINVSAENNDKKLATVQAITNLLATAVTTTIDFKNFDTKALFDSFIATGGFVPTIAFISDTVAFDYTDNAGNSAVDIEWMFVVCVDEEGTVSTSMINNSDASNLTGDEIAALISNTSNINLVNDAQLSAINNLPSDTSSMIATKQDSEFGKGLSANNFTDTHKSKIDNLPNDTTQQFENVVRTTDTKYGNVPDNTNNELFGKVDKVSGKSLTDNNLTDELKSKIDNLPSDTNQQFENVVRTTDTKYGNIPDDTNEELSGKVDKVSGKYLTDNNLTNELKSKIDNSPNDTTTELSNKVSTSKITTDINDAAGFIPDAPTVKSAIAAVESGDFNGGTISNPLVVTSSTDNKALFTMKRLSNAIGLGLAWQNAGDWYTNAIFVDESDGDKLKFTSGSGSTIGDLPSVLELNQNLVEIKVPTSIEGNLSLTNGGRFSSRNVTATDSYIGSVYRMNGSDSDSNWAIYKADQGNTNGLDGTKAADGRSFSGSALRVRVPNSTSQGLIVENSFGINLFEINGSTGIATFANNLESLGLILCNGLESNQDITINSNTLNLNSTTSDGEGDIVFTNSGSPQNKRSFKLFPDVSGVFRLRSLNDSGGSVHNFEFSHDGDLSFDGNLECGASIVDNSYVQKDGRFGREAVNHNSNNVGRVDYGNTVSSTFTGMRINTSWDGTYNDEDINFLTHNGGNNANVRMTIDRDGNTEIYNKLSVGKSTSPTVELDVEGDTKTSGDIIVGGNIVVYDEGGHEHRLEHGRDGIELRAMSNPLAGDPIFSVASSGDSKRLVVEHDGAITTSNVEIRVATSSDGSGGIPVMTPENIGDLQASYDFFGGIPVISNADVATWFRQRADITFGSVGALTVNLPEIVASNPNGNQVLAGSVIEINNANNISNISLSRFNSGQTFIIDNIANQRSSATILHSTRIKLKAHNVTGYKDIPTNWAWYVSGN